MTTKVRIEHADGVRSLEARFVKGNGEVFETRTIPRGESLATEVHAEQSLVIAEAEEAPQAEQDAPQAESAGDAGGAATGPEKAAG